MAHSPWQAIGEDQLVRTRLRKLLVYLALAFGSLTGAYMRPDEVEELTRTRNEPLVETAIPDESRQK
jgi:hypothetical protein